MANNKKQFEITNKNTGLSLGTYEASDEIEALDACSKDAGYSSYEQACETTGTDDLVATEVE